MRRDPGRGQVVLLAGVFVALALLTMLAAFLQLGYGADVATSGPDDRAVEDGQAFLERVTVDATAELRGNYDWSERDQAVTALRNRLQARQRTLERSRVEAGIVVNATVNATAAREWRRTQCPPSEPGRRFGPCEADRGVVVQERDDRTLVLAVGYDLEVTTDREIARLTTVVEPVE